MSFHRILTPLLCFGLGWGVTSRIRSRREETAVNAGQSAMISRISRTSVPVARSPRPPGGKVSLEDEIAGYLARPADERHDEALARRCAELLPVNPSAAFRVGMARWAFDPNAQRAAAAALVRTDPAAARRLLPGCRDIRSRSMLKSCLMADRVARDPRQKLPWAAASLEGHARYMAVMTGAAALAPEDPDAVLAFALEFPPGPLTVLIMSLGLERKLPQDPAGTAAWIHANVPDARKTDLCLKLFQAFAETAPDRARALLPHLAPELREPMIEVLLAEAVAGGDTSGENYEQGIETIRGFPQEMRIPAFRELVSRHIPENDEQCLPQILAAATGPGERAAVIESFVIRAFETPGPDREALLSQFRTQRDKAAAARIVPYLTGLTDEERALLLSRLK